MMPAEYLDVHNFRIRPARILFDNVTNNYNTKRKVTVQNISDKVKSVRFYPPQSESLILLSRDVEVSIAPGIIHSAVVRLQIREVKPIEDSLVIVINGDPVKIPINVIPCRAILEIPRDLYFGRLVQANRVITRKFSIHNRGFKAGRFHFTNSSSPLINIYPSNGTVNSLEDLEVTVTYIPKEIKVFKEYINAELENADNQILQIWGEVIKPKFILKNCKKDSMKSHITKNKPDIVHWNFKAMYYNTDKICLWSLLNFSPEPSSFVAVLCNEKPKITIHGEKSSNQKSEKNEFTDPNENQITQCLKMFPDHGNLEPFEHHPFLVHLKPRWKKPKTGFATLSESPQSKSFTVYLQIKKVEVGHNNESMKEDPKSVRSNTLENLEETQDLEVVLTGSFLPVQLDIMHHNNLKNPNSLKPNANEIQESDHGESIRIHSLDQFNERVQSMQTNCGKKCSLNRILIDFGSILVGEKRQDYFVLVNQSKQLPIRFKIPRVAHFINSPDEGTIGPQCKISIKVEFSPKQCGLFEVSQMVQVLGKVVDENNFHRRKNTVIFEREIVFRGRAQLLSKLPEVKFNPGIVPVWKHEVGRCTDLVAFGSKYPCPKTALTNASGPKSYRGLRSHIMNSWKEFLTNSIDTLEQVVKIAFPNDRASSIRPSAKNEKYSTIFCRLPRYTYSDLDYELTDEELAHKFQQELMYTTMLTERTQMADRNKRDKELAKWEKKPYDGMALLDLAEFLPKLQLPKEEYTEKGSNKLFNSIELISDKGQKIKDTESDQVTIPVAKSTNKEISESCYQPLTAKELHQISIVPSTIDFENVCPNISKKQSIQITNPLNQPICFQMNFESDELKQTNPLKYIIDAGSVKTIPVTFKATRLGKFQGNLNFSLNHHHNGNLIVSAKIVPIHLELSHATVEFGPNQLGYGLVGTNGIRNFISLYNPYHATAHFTWEPMDCDSTFSICPRSGSVQPFTTLMCEVTYFPSLQGPYNGKMKLCLPCLDESHFGSSISSNDDNIASNSVLAKEKPVTSQTGIMEKEAHLDNFCELTCIPKLPPCKLNFSTKRLALGSIAHGVPCTREISLLNNGQGPILFKILSDENGNSENPSSALSTKRKEMLEPVVQVDMMIRPNQGEVPVGGTLPIKITCIPFGIGKFESNLIVRTHDGSLANLSVCGSTIKPEIRFLYDRSEFGGVPVGGQAELPFGVENIGTSRALLEIHLKDYQEFEIRNKAEHSVQKEMSFADTARSVSNIDIKLNLKSASTGPSSTPPGFHGRLDHDFEGKIAKIHLPPQTKWIGTIHYKPIQVAFHDFKLPILVNKLSVENLCQPDHNLSRQSSQLENQPNIESEMVNLEIQLSHHIFAIGLRQPLVIDPADGNLEVFKSLNDSQSDLKKVTISMTSLISSNIKWELDVHAIQKFNKRRIGLIEIWDHENTQLLPNIEGFICGSIKDTIRIEFQMKLQKPGIFHIQLPLWITIPKEKPNNPMPERQLYKILQLKIDVQQIHLTCEPTRIMIPPIGSGIEFRVPVRICGHHLNQPLELSVCCPLPIRNEDGFTNQLSNFECPFSIEFPEGRFLKPSTQNSSNSQVAYLNIWVHFKCAMNGIVFATHPRPLCLVFTASSATSYEHNTDQSSEMDKLDKSYYCVALPVSASVDNSLISWYDSMARRSKEIHIGFDETFSNKKTRINKDKQTAVTKLVKIFKSLNNLRLIQMGFRESMETCSMTSSLNHSQTNENFISSNMFSQLSRSFDHLSISKSESQNDVEHLFTNRFFIQDWELYDQTAVELVQRWLIVHGFPKGPYPIKFPEQFRSCISLASTIQDLQNTSEKPRGLKLIPKSIRSSSTTSTTNQEYAVSRSLSPLYNCLVHLSGGKSPPGVPNSIMLHTDQPAEALSTVYFYLASLLTFVRSQGGCLSHILPEHLMDPTDYHSWYSLGCPGLTESTRNVLVPIAKVIESEPGDASVTSVRSVNQTCETDKVDKIHVPLLPELNRIQFIDVSKRAWTDFMLQLIKCLVFERLTIKQLDQITLPPKDLGITNSINNPDPEQCTTKQDFAIESCTQSKTQPSPTNKPKVGSKSDLNQTEFCLTDEQSSSCYSNSEKILLAWLNYCFKTYSKQIWPNHPPIIPSMESDLSIIRNFDYDLRDGLVLACVIAAYIPCLIPNYFSKMFTQPSSLEQCFHNAILIVSALKSIHFEYDLRASDITSPHPVGMLLLCLHLFHNLPDFIPQQTIQFIDALHSSCKQQILLSNPFHEPLLYHCFIVGPDSADFTCMANTSLGKNRKYSNRPNLSIKTLNLGQKPPEEIEQKHTKVGISSHGKVHIIVEYRSRFFKPTKAYLFAVCERHGPAQGKTLAFTLSGNVNGLGSQIFIKVTSPCYEMRELKIPVYNPYTSGGLFEVSLLESQGNLFDAISCTRKLGITQKQNEFTKSQSSEYRLTTREGSSSEGSFNSSKVVEQYQQNHMQAFFCPESCIELTGKQTRVVEEVQPKLSLTQPNLSKVSTQKEHLDNIKLNESKSITLIYLPLSWGERDCCLLFSNSTIGEFVIVIRGFAELPRPSPVPFTDTKETIGRLSRCYRITSAVAAASFGQSGDPNVIYLRCPLGYPISETLQLPVNNQARRTALFKAIQIRLPPNELKRRKLAQTLESDDLLEMANKILTLPSYALAHVQKVAQPNVAKMASRKTTYMVNIDSNILNVPPTVSLQAKPETADLNSVFPLTIKAKLTKSGLLSAKLILQGPDDIRLYCIECVTVPDNQEISLTFTAPLNQTLTQPIPIPNKTAYDWELRSKFEGPTGWYTGPPRLTVPSNTTVQYPVTFLARRELEVQAKLTLINQTDGGEHVFNLHGKGLKPLSLGLITVKCSTSGCDFHTRINGSTRSPFHPFTVKLPNPTSVKQIYRLQTNLPKDLVTYQTRSKATLDVLPGRTEEFCLLLNTIRRGSYKGVLAFESDLSKLEEDDSDSQDNTGSLIHAHHTTEPKSIYRVWYEVDIRIEPGPSLHQIEVICACLSCAVVKIPICLKSEWFLENDDLEFEVILEGNGLIGPTTHCVKKPQNNETLEYVYRVEYWPAVVGKSQGSVIFYHPKCGEFWIELKLNATKPDAINVPCIECELGSCKISSILLHNPTHETYLLEPRIENSDIFSLQLGTSAKQLARISARGYSSVTKHRVLSSKTSSTREFENSQDIIVADDFSTGDTRKGFVILEPKCSLRIGLKFIPCDLGEEEHRSCLIFHSDKLSELRFNLSGNGLVPKPRDPYSVSVMIGSATTFILPILNPFKVPVKMDINLTPATISGLFKRLESTRDAIMMDLPKPVEQNLDNSKDTSLKTMDHRQTQTKSGTDLDSLTYNAFQLLLKSDRNIQLASKSNFGIPISFAPVQMHGYEAMCSIAMKPVQPTQSGTKAVRWLIPIQGKPEIGTTFYSTEIASSLLGSSQNLYKRPIVIQGTARSVTHFVLDLSLNQDIRNIGAVGNERNFGATVQMRALDSTSSCNAGEDDLFADVPENFISSSSSAWNKLESSEVEWTLIPVISSDGQDLTESYDIDQLLASSVNVRLIRIWDKNDGTMNLCFGITFAPPRSFKCCAELAIQTHMGATWKFRFIIKSKNPPMDDTIFLPHKGLNRPTKALLHLTSSSSNAEEFRAILLPDSQNEFSIEPQSGILPPKISDATKNMESADAPITVTFLPRTYGKTVRARLVIQTQSSEWHYQLLGVLEPYQPPKGTSHPTTFRVRSRRVNEKYQRFIEGTKCSEYKLLKEGQTKV